MFSAERPGTPGIAVGRARQLHAQHFVQVRGRVGADQQHACAAVRQRHGRGAGQRGLAHAALAGEEQKAGWRLQKTGRRLSVGGSPSFLLAVPKMADNTPGALATIPAAGSMGYGAWLCINWAPASSPALTINSLGIVS